VRDHKTIFHNEKYLGRRKKKGRENEEMRRRRNDREIII